MRAALWLVALSLVSAGCIGFDDDGGDGNETDDNLTDDDNGSDEGLGAGGNVSGGGGNVSGNVSGNASGNASGNFSGNFSGNASIGNGTGNGTGNETGTTRENRTGSISGANLIVANQATAEEVFTVENGTATLLLNLTVEGDDVEMTVIPPGCEDSSCEQTAATSDGNASLTVDAPDEGEWTVELAGQGTGFSSADYNLEIVLVAGTTATA